MISLNLTVNAASINPTPTEKTIKNINGNQENKTVQCNSDLVTAITTINAQNDAPKLIALETILDTTNKYLGIYTFLINAAFPIIAPIAEVVDSEKKLKASCPVNKYNGKLSTENLNRFEYTTDNTAIIHNGFNSVQNTPKTDLLYLILISLATNSFNSGWNFI